MAIALKYNTASQEIPLGYFVDSTDGNTEETGLTIANTDIKLWKSGATTLANKNSGGATHISNGVYYATLDATDTNTLGPMVIFVHVTGALPVRVETVVYPAVIYDSIIAGTDYLQTDLTQIAGSAVATSSAQLGVNVVNWKGSVAAAMTGDAYARLGAPAGASVSADVAAVKTDTAAILVDTGTDIPAQITGLNDPTAAAIADAVWDEATAGHVTAGTFAVLATDVLTDTGTTIPNQITGLNDPTAAAIADAVWDEAISGHLGAGSTGEALNAAGSAGDPWSTGLPGAYGAGSAGYIIGNNINAPLDVIDSNVDAILVDTGTDIPASFAALNDPTAAAIADAVWDEATAGHVTAGTFAVLATDVLTDTGTTIQGQITALNDPSAAAIADAVWDEALSGHAIAGSAGEALSAAGAAGDPWATAVPGAYGAGTAGYIVGTNLDAAVSSVGGIGSGAISWTITVDDGVNPIDGAEVWISSDSAGSNIVAGTLTTNASGEATFMLDAGTYYAWIQKGGYNFTNPSTIIVS